MTRERFTATTIVPAAAVIAAGILVAVGLATAYYEDQSLHAQQLARIAAQAEVLASGVEASLVFNDPSASREYVNAMRADAELSSVGVYNASGSLVAGFTRNGAPPLPGVVLPHVPYGAPGLTVYTGPVVENRQTVGTVYLAARAEALQQRVWRYVPILLLVFMAGVMLVMSAAVQRALSRSNRELRLRAHALDEVNGKLRDEMAQRARAEEELRQSQKMEAIGKLSGGIAHDFNNLLTVIGGNMTLLERRLAAGRTDVARYIDAANEGIRRATSLTQRVLAFSRRQPLTAQRVEIDALISNMKDLLRHSVGEQVSFQLALASRHAIFCDANQMENVLLNLAINARDAMPRGGTLTISTADVRLAPGTSPGGVCGDFVRIAVTDTGSGMTEDVRARAIDPFFTTKPLGQGTGLGLSMSYGYVRQSGGDMQIESAPGAGTSIILLMPRHDGDRT
ncbi:MAG TPA: ATP-binding protein [Rhizomicrobium sp.]|nr:ATP-binding protein [Rhizomicrobium sp.]